MKRKYALCMITCLIVILLSYRMHNTKMPEVKQLKVGFIFVGDEITPYTYNFMKARENE